MNEQKLLPSYKFEKLAVIEGSFPVNDFPKKEPTDKCNGKVHRQFRYCKRPAGWGTSHPGTGRCKLHGGCSTGKKSGLLRYSDYVPTDIIEKYEEFASESDTDIKSLNDEIALLRAKITDAESKNNDGRYDRSIIVMMEEIRRLVETKQKVEEGIKSKITIEFAGKLVDSVIKIIEECVPDIDTKKLIAGRIRRLNEHSLGFNDN